MRWRAAGALLAVVTGSVPALPADAMAAQMGDEGGSIVVTVLAVIGALVVLALLLGTCGDGNLGS